MKGRKFKSYIYLLVICCYYCEFVVEVIPSEYNKNGMFLITFQL